MKYKVGDIVRTTKDLDEYGAELFPIGTVGIITNIDKKNKLKLHYKVETETDYWYYSEDMLELVSIEKTYEQGLTDAWELARKIFAMNDNEFNDAFGNVHREDTFCYNTPQEALAKLKTYEDRKIEEWDVVLYGDKEVEILITQISGNLFEGFKIKNDEYGRTGGVYSGRSLRDCKKTGKHIDIRQLLDSIGD